MSEAQFISGRAAVEACNCLGRYRIPGGWTTWGAMRLQGETFCDNAGRKILAPDEHRLATVDEIMAEMAQTQRVPCLQLDEPTPTWRSYVSHKRVKAARIERVEMGAGYVARIHLEGGLTMGPGCHVPFPENFFARYTPVAGDYVVLYPDDDYKSLSPKAAFEGGYTLEVGS